MHLFAIALQQPCLIRHQYTPLEAQHNPICERRNVAEVAASSSILLAVADQLPARINRLVDVWDGLLDQLPQLIGQHYCCGWKCGQELLGGWPGNATCRAGLFSRSR